SRSLESPASRYSPCRVHRSPDYDLADVASIGFGCDDSCHCRARCSGAFSCLLRGWAFGCCGCLRLRGRPRVATGGLFCTHTDLLLWGTTPNAEVALRPVSPHEC